MLNYIMVLMECKCSDVWIRTHQSFGEACRILSIKNSDCTVADVGCLSMLQLRELQRHMSVHGIKCDIIGIDINPSGFDGDEFVQKNILDVSIHDVSMHDVADIVVCENFFGQFERSHESWSKAVRNSANILKNDGIMITQVTECVSWVSRMFTRGGLSQKYIKMTKNEALEHADRCFKMCSKKCGHGSVILPHPPAWMACAPDES